MRRSDAHEYRQAYNAQAVVCADGSAADPGHQPVATTADAPSFAATILAMENNHRPAQDGPRRYRLRQRSAVAALQARDIEPLVAIGRTQPHRPYDFRPPPEPKPARRITEPWRHRDEGQAGDRRWPKPSTKRKQTVEPVFGIIKSAIGFVRFHLRGLQNVATEWTLIALAYNCRRLTACRPPERNQPRYYQTPHEPNPTDW